MLDAHGQRALQSRPQHVFRAGRVELGEIGPREHHARGREAAVDVERARQARARVFEAAHVARRSLPGGPRPSPSALRSSCGAFRRRVRRPAADRVPPAVRRHLSSATLLRGPDRRPESRRTRRCIRRDRLRRSNAPRPRTTTATPAVPASSGWLPETRCPPDRDGSAPTSTGFRCRRGSSAGARCGVRRDRWRDRGVRARNTRRRDRGRDRSTSPCRRARASARRGGTTRRRDRSAPRRSPVEPSGCCRAARSAHPASGNAA